MVIMDRAKRDKLIVTMLLNSQSGSPAVVPDLER